MKTLLLLITLFISTLVSGQEYCSYDTRSSVSFGYDSEDEAFKIIELPDGKFLLIGTTYFINSNSFRASVCRMNSDDSIDLTYGQNGRTSLTWDQRNTCNTASLQADNKVLIGGYQAPGNGVSTFRPYVARLNEDGSTDMSFGVEGSAKLDIQSGLKGSTVGIKELENGKIQAAVITNNPAGFALFQLNADGSYDNDFNGNGLALNVDPRVYWQTSYGGALFLEDGSVIFCTKTFSSNTTKALLCKVNSNGELDMGFGIDGTLEIETPIQYNFAGIHMVFDANENIILGTTSENAPKKYQVTKISSETGIVDTNFGVDGIAASTNTDLFNALHGLAIDPTNGDIYAIGASSTANRAGSVWLINEAGEEVDQCDGSAMFSYTFQFYSGLRDAAFFADGNIKLVGFSGHLDETTPEDTDQGSNFYIPVSSTNGLNELEQSDLSIYPNPVIDNLNIQIADNIKIESYSILNQLGQIVITANQSNKTIATASLVPGIYFLEIYSSKGVAIRKFIKQ